MQIGLELRHIPTDIIIQGPNIEEDAIYERINPILLWDHKKAIAKAANQLEKELGIPAMKILAEQGDFEIRLVFQQ